MWKISVEDDQGNRTTVNLVRDEYTIGRDQDNTVRLTERNISRRHALLRKNGTGWEIEDQSSYNGCFVNGTRVCEPQPLEHGDLIQLGDYRLRVINESAEIVDEKTPTQPRGRGLVAGLPLAASTLEHDRFVMLTGPTPGAEFILEREQLLVGRGEECDISINHSSVSRVHAEIRKLHDGTYEVIDQQSANGVRINGNELSRGLLESHDSIELGDIALKFIAAGEDYVPPPPEQLEQLAAAEEVAAPGAQVKQRAATRSLAPRLLQSMAAVVGLGLVLAVVAVLVGDRGDESGQISASGIQVDEASRALAKAKALLERGQTEAAHDQALSGVPEQSNLRESEDFLAIEARWADLLLQRAGQETDPERQRALLEQVVRATTVDSARRRRAADQLAILGADGVDVSDLPSMNRAASASGRPSKPPPAPAEEEAPVRVAVQPRPARVAAHIPAPVNAAPADDNPYDDPEELGAAPPAPATAPKPAQPRSPGGSATEKATSGDRAAQIAAKDALKAKVASGRASEREKRVLRALCRQFGDPSCAN
jgi:pSer/pThr/pTyr-binding forkhead associated (FHA) protein